jgi:hypothetical protein
VTHVGWAQDGAIAIFDWAFQLQPGNPSLSPIGGQVARSGDAPVLASAGVPATGGPTGG